MPPTTPNDSKPPFRPAPPDDGKKARLADQLRANLQRRKTQARARRSGEADRRPDGLATGDDDGDAS